MAKGSRKRKRAGTKQSNDNPAPKQQSRVSQSLLASYYPLVLPLKDYLSLLLPLPDPQIVFPDSTPGATVDAGYLRLAESLIAVDENDAQAVRPLQNADHFDKGKWANWKPPAADSFECSSDSLFQVSGILLVTMYAVPSISVRPAES